MNASQRRRYGRKVEKINRALEDVWLPRIRKTIQAKADAVIPRLRSGTAMEFISKDLGNAELSRQVKRLYTHVGLIHAKRVNGELRGEPKTLKRLGFNATWAAFVNDYLDKFLLEKITFAVNETTRDALMRAVQKGINDGLGVDDIIRILEDWPFARFQAARIVRTEINRAANVGAMAGGSTFKFEQQKEWIAAKDSRTRGNPMTGQEDHANHWKLDGSVVDEKQVFTDSRNGDQLQFPGDPSASAASVVNCRCSVAMTAKRDEKGRLIPKRGISVILPGQINRPRTITIGKEWKPDYSEILSRLNDLGEKVNAVVNKSLKVNSEKIDKIHEEIKTDQLMQKLHKFEEEFTEVGQVINVIRVKGEDLTSEVNETKNELGLLITKKQLEEERNFNNLMKLIDSKEYNPEIKVETPEVMESVNNMRSDLVKTKNLLSGLITRKTLEDERTVTKLINLINSKEYNPEIKLKTDSPEVVQSVNSMRSELLRLLQALRDELIKKKKWLHTIQRDSKELIKTITSQEI